MNILISGPMRVPKFSNDTWTFWERTSFKPQLHCLDGSRLPHEAESIFYTNGPGKGISQHNCVYISIDM